MELILAFIIFIASMIGCLSAGISMIVPLIIGIAAFILVGLRRKFPLKDLLRMAVRGAWGARFVVIILVLIGCLTALWRQSGTIAYFTYYGVKLIPSSVFVLAAFLLTSLMSYALGTSFGTAATMGVILMTIARASGISLAVSGGAVMSGLYFGDRGSPAASSASLVANETGTDVSENFRKMLPSSLLPMACCFALYALLSLFNRPESMNAELLTHFEGEFRLSLWCLLPTAVLLALAFAGMKIKYAMMIDIAVSAAAAMLLQKAAPADVLRAVISGFTPKNEALASVLSGGGIASMLEVVFILLLSSACSGIFEGTKMLGAIEKLFAGLCGRIGRFPAMIAAGLVSAAVFCNQTISIIMCRQFMGGNYLRTSEEREALMLDIENSVITLAGMVPWCIACSVPLGMMGCGFGAIPFSFYLYLLPLFWYFRRRHESRKKRIG